RDRIQFDDLIPRYNIAPTQPVVALRTMDQAESLVWGLIPRWSNEPKSIINARAETLDDKPSFSESFQHRRCLILADGFYEWRRTGRARQAFYFQLRDEGVFAFAGIWDKWKNGQTSVTTCAIITTTANELLASIHDRMPVILRPESYELCLHSEISSGELKKLLEPYPGDEMKSHPVSSQVNFAESEGEDLIQHVDFEVGTTPSLF